MTARAFQVDLRGIVDLLSHHLYASPRVFVRELLQNAVDAITARHAVDGSGGRIDIVPADVSDDGRLHVTDDGIGLRPDEVETFLATIGRSSKRDELGFARQDFLGQFGIGLLSCFLVTDEIVVTTRSGHGGPAVRWHGTSDGAYTVELLDDDRPVGTTVSLAPRRGAEDWLSAHTVEELARTYGGLLPVAVYVRTAEGNVRVSGDPPPWLARGSVARRAALRSYAETALGFTPLDVVPLDVPVAGLTGAAYVLPEPVNPAVRPTHRVYLKRMLLGERVEGLVPDWAFFVRCVVDVTELRPTASREALYDDEVLAATREAVGAQLREWLLRLAVADPARLQAFLSIHHLGIKALAAHDDELLRVVLPWLTFETTLGHVPLEEFARTYDVVRFTGTVDDFRQVSAVAAAHGIGVVNAGYAYEQAILERVPSVLGLRVEHLDPTSLTTHFASVATEEELAVRGFLARAAAVLDRVGCDVVVRVFEPATLPALYLVDRDARHRQALRETREQVDEVWADVLAAVEDERAGRPQLVLNHLNPTVRRVARLGDDELVRIAVESLYAQALLRGHHRLRPVDTALVNRSFLALLERATSDLQDRS